MARNVGAGSTQGPTDEGTLASGEFPIVIAGKSSTAAGAVKRVPKINADGSVDSTVVSAVAPATLPLPTGASTEATLALIKAKTDNLDVALSTRTKPADSQTVTGTVAVSNFPATQPVSGTVAVSNLPATQPVSGTVTANQGTQGAGGTASWPVQGAGADNAALAGSPHRIGISDGTNLQTMRQATPATLTATAGTGIPATGIYVSDGTNLRAVVIAGDGGSSNNTMAVAAHIWNGASMERARGNIDTTLLASSGRTTTQTSADITTYNTQAITVTLDMTVVAAGPSVTVTIDGKDPASGKYYNLLTGAAVIAVTTNTYRVDPALVAVANLIAVLRLPRIIRIVVTANNANSGTYSVGYTLHSGGG